MAKPIVEVIPYEYYNVVHITNRPYGVSTRIYKAPDYRENFEYVVDIEGNYFYDLDIDREDRLSPRYKAEFIAEDDRGSDVGWTFHDVFVPDANASRIVADGGVFHAGNGDYQATIDDKIPYVLFTFHASKPGKIYSAYTLVLHTSYLKRVTDDGGTVHSASNGIPRAKKIVQRDNTPIMAITFDASKPGTIYSMVDYVL